jgi:ABC-type glycerol-3-phosphate transport system substrate-binding protein
MKRILIVVGFLTMLTTVPVFATGNKEKDVSGGQKPVTMRFVWWGSDVRHQVTLAAIDRYQELYPHITIEVEYQGYSGYLQKRNRSRVNRRYLGEKGVAPYRNTRTNSF